MTNKWTKVLVVLLVLEGIGGLWALSSFELSQLEMLGIVANMELILVLAAVSWMETKLGNSVVMLLLVIKFAEGIVSANLELIPEYGPQWGQYAYSLIYLVFAAVSYLSYRKITEKN
jgi:hypothetical protein